MSQGSLFTPTLQHLCFMSTLDLVRILVRIGVYGSGGGGYGGGNGGDARYQRFVKILSRHTYPLLCLKQSCGIWRGNRP